MCSSDLTEPQGTKDSLLVESLCCLIRTADYYSLSEKVTDGSQDFRGTGTLLESIFAKLRLAEDTPETLYYQLYLLDPTVAFPGEAGWDQGRGRKFVDGFINEFDNLSNKIALDDFDVVYTHLLSLLQRYTWCLPSSAGKYQDISLFDHLRITSAISACLYRYHQNTDNFDQSDIIDNKTDKFRLVVGDISGIQKYIFEIAGIGVGGVAKRLRARSFYLSALAEAITHKIIHELALPLSNIIISSGGKFYILLPNTEYSKLMLNEFQRELDTWFVREYFGELSLNMAQVSFNGEGLINFGEVLGTLSERLAERKSNPLNTFLIHDGMWHSDGFLIDHQVGTGGICQCCRKHRSKVVVDDVHLCSHCDQNARMGKRLANARYVALMNSDLECSFPVFPLIDGYQVAVLDDPPPAELPSYLVYKLNDTDLQEICHHPALPKFMANYIPLADKESTRKCEHCSEVQCPAPGEPLYFDCLANRARGRKLLGYLKADVDYMGSLFVLGLREDMDDRNNISRMATLSRMLDLFFSGWVEKLLASEYRNCYTVYSGGDDLLIIGPWDESVSLAARINREFRSFTNNNANISLSAGITLAKPRVPLSRSVALAEDALEKSKETVLRGEKSGRNQITFLDSTFKWNQFYSVLPVSGQVANWLDLDFFSTNFVRNLLLYGKMVREFHEKGDIRGMRYLPLLTYAISRNYPDLNKQVYSDQKELKVARFWLESLKDINRLDTIHLLFIAQYALLAKGG